MNIYFEIIIMAYSYSFFSVNHASPRVLSLYIFFVLSYSYDF